jgi:hypothetical protein
MFAPGQKVWHRRNQRSGTVQECDGSRVYIVQENGVELDFDASDLTATPPEGASAAPSRPIERGQIAPSSGQDVPVRKLTPRDITSEHERVLASVPVRTLQAIATLFDRQSKGAKFSALDLAGKLNAITDITALPYRTMRQHVGSPGEMGMLMGKGIADRQKAG